MKKYCTMILTCDKYADIWPITLGEFEKQWPMYNNYLFFNTESKKYEGETRLNLKYPTKTFDPKGPWAYRLLSCLEEIEEEYVVLLLDDFILTDYVDVEELERCISYMDADPQIACFNFRPTPGPSIRDEYGRYELKETKSEFRINLQAALWRKSFLMKFIRKHESPWQFETWGSVRARRFKNKIYHLKKGERAVFIYPEGGVIADERWRWFDEDKIQLVEQLGYDIDFNKRGIYHKGEPRKTEIVRRTFLQKCWQVVKSLV